MVPKSSQEDAVRNLKYFYKKTAEKADLIISL
jgi:hypothetical protein